jgi:hypothetical protein
MANMMLKILAEIEANAETEMKLFLDSASVFSPIIVKAILSQQWLPISQSRKTSNYNKAVISASVYYAHVKHVDPAKNIL